MRLLGKTAIITGAASGIGKAIAVRFAGEGARVIVSDINMEGAKLTAEGITESGGTAAAVAANVAKEEDVRNLVDTAVKTYGTTDILVNNAGVMDDFSAAGDVTDALWERLFSINTGGPMRAIRKVLPIFLAKGQGVIINIASVGGLQGCRGGTAYTVSKHALIGLTRAVGFQYAAKGIRCNAIAPGAVETNIGASIGKPNDFGMSRALAGLNLNPRTGKPEEIASVALFLASDESSFVNGTVLVADAGWTAY